MEGEKNTKSNIALLNSLNLIKLENGDYYVYGTYYEYIRYLSCKSNYDTIYLITTVRKGNNTNGLQQINVFSNLEIVELPYASSYLTSLKNFFVYYKVLKDVSSKVDLFYCRVPDPFSWMSRLIFKKKTIIHFVGDTIEATKCNERWSFFRKLIMILGYLPEYTLALIAARKSKAVTNGKHLADRLKPYGVRAEAVISSIVSEDSMIDVLPSIKDSNTLRLIYIGYIRYAKGFDCMMKLWLSLKAYKDDFIFDIIGNGEMLEEVSKFVSDNDLQQNVILHGQIDDRGVINEMLSRSDLFIFTSLSEGSPRVVIEAMSQGVPVISTPVGSLPTTFEDKVDIRFAEFNNPDRFLEIVQEYTDNRAEFVTLRQNAYDKVKNNYTSEAFFNKIFTI